MFAVQVEKFWINSNTLLLCFVVFLSDDTKAKGCFKLFW